MEPAGKILGAALRRMKDADAAQMWLAANWKAIAGKSVAAHTRPVVIRDGIFRVEADSVEWKNQVEEMRTILSERINRAWGGTLVRGIQIESTRGRSQRIPYAEDNSHTPFIRRPRKRESP